MFLMRHAVTPMLLCACAARVALLLLYDEYYYYRYYYATLLILFDAALRLLIRAVAMIRAYEIEQNERALL